MMLKLQKSYTLHKQGKRKNNEDYFFVPDNTAQKLFVVCDGVGGANKGEVASKLACSSFAEYLLNAQNKPIDKLFWQEALKYTEQKFSEVITLQPTCAGMGTTLVMLYFEAQKAQVAWCGDSRLYQFRNGKIIYKTKDHSFVQKMVDEGQITEQEAQTHPRKNIILRAINGTDNATELEFHTLEDIQKNDLFLLCSDGIIENLSDQKLVEVIALADTDYDFAIEQLDTFCQVHSHDNYTCVLIPVEGIEKINKPLPPPTPQKPQKPQKAQFSDKMSLLAMLGVAVFLLGLAFYFFTEKKQAAQLQAAQRLDAKNAEIEQQRIAQAQKDSLTIQNLTKDSLQQILNAKLAFIDSLAIQNNDTLGKFNELKDLERGRFYFATGDTALAFAALKDWTQHEWRDSLLDKKDWLNLRLLFEQNLQQDSAYLQQIAICDTFLNKLLDKEQVIENKAIENQESN